MPTIYNKRGTKYSLSILNPILGSGELCLEIDTNRIKFGDGNSNWNSLPYAIIPSGTSNGQFLQYSVPSGTWFPSSSGNFTTLQVNGTGVSISGHTHTSSDITNFNSSVSGLLPVTNISAGSGIAVSSSSGNYTVSSDLNTSLVAGTGITFNYSNNNLTFNTSIDYSISQGRLTLSSNNPNPSGDITAATTLYYTPYNGNQIGLYNTTTSSWEIYKFNQISYSLSTLSSGVNYDVFVYNNSGTGTLELASWSNNTTRNTELSTQDNIYIKNGSANKRYVGTIRTTSTTTTEDSKQNRFVWNMYNKIEKSVYKTTADTSWTYSTNSWRATNNSVTEIGLVNGIQEELIDLNAGLLFTIGAGIISSGLSVYSFGIAKDANLVPSTNNPNASTRIWVSSESQAELLSYYRDMVDQGYHYFYPVERYVSGSTPTLYGGNNSQSWFGGIMGKWRC